MISDPLINDLKTKHKITIVLFPILFLFLSEVFRVMNTDLYIYFFYEDSYIEYLQAIIILVTAVIAFLIAKGFHSLDQKVMSWLYIIAGLTTTFILLEEISWGQRILDIPTPEYFSKNNLQNELNFHNLNTIQHKTGLSWLYLIMATILIYASSAWLISPKILTKKFDKHIHFFVPNYLSAHYIITSVSFITLGKFNLLPEPTIWNMQEATETVFYLGFLIFFIFNRIRCQHLIKQFRH